MSRTGLAYVLRELFHCLAIVVVLMLMWLAVLGFVWLGSETLELFPEPWPDWVSKIIPTLFGDPTR